VSGICYQGLMMPNLQEGLPTSLACIDFTTAAAAVELLPIFHECAQSKSTQNNTYNPIRIEKTSFLTF
jgi:hypothetical protein